MTTLLMTSEALQDMLTAEEDNLMLCKSKSAHISEETEYVRKLRTMLEDIRHQIFKDELDHKIPQHTSCSKSCCCNTEYESEGKAKISPCGFNLIMEKMKDKDLQLQEMNKENEFLKIKLEASREAGAAALRSVAKKLFGDYEKQREELRKKHEDEKKLLQVNNFEKEKIYKQHVECLKQVTERLGGKHCQIAKLENLVQKMEEEKKLLLEKKACLQFKLDQLLLNSKDAKSCKDLQTEISTLQRQISCLQFVIYSQHQNLRSVIQEMEGLKNDLQEQDKMIETLKEKVNVLEAQNKDLKNKIKLWSECSKTKVSKGVCTSELMAEDTSPYLMLMRLRK
ncbi:coiled-coil domain-containing protein 68 isoform X2 [Monodelphis domestica]|uniref:Coiled-coil domain containing 68 n=1 Tax=Monodelphis domestica TaxID=13616 RepID=A0A5F8G3S3_MONDO|nr:coiled-coil domain-containing protein 68 isoform X2 [Monodelphis domestica]XP_056680430.1 coiled-coil domain-containing protein 68 isoform X2 [Monodelphis domestica]